MAQNRTGCVVGARRWLSQCILLNPTPLIPSEVEGHAQPSARPSTSLGMSGFWFGCTGLKLARAHDEFPASGYPRPGPSSLGTDPHRHGGDYPLPGNGIPDSLLGHREEAGFVTLIGIAGLRRTSGFLGR